MSTPTPSPLAEIEQRVLERAKEQLLDLDGEDAERRLRLLIEDEIAQWSLDHKHGQRPFDLLAPDMVAERAFRNLARYGPLTVLLEDDDVWEVMINAPDQIFVKRHSGVSGYHDEAFHDDAHVVRTLTKLLDDASTAHRKLDRGVAPSWTTAPACTSCTATWAATGTWWSTSASSPGWRSGRWPNWWSGACSPARPRSSCGRA